MLVNKQLFQALTKYQAKLQQKRIVDLSFLKQNNFIQDTAKLKAALCTRRSGKSYGAGLYMADTCEQYEEIKCLYVALTRDSAKKIMWNDVLKTINRKFKLNARFNEIELSMTFSNGSSIQLVGADAKPAEMEKFLGQKYKLVIIDEAASYKQDLRKMVYEILEPATVDGDGQIVLIGTPSDLTKSLYYDITTGKEKGWAIHKWSAFDNPYIAEKWKAQIDKMIERDPLVVETPAYKRMYLGEWYIDTDKLVYKYDAILNQCDSLPTIKSWERYYYVLGIDLGYDDATAFTICAYHPNDPNLYIIYAKKFKNLIIADVAKKIKSLSEQYDIGTMIIDNANKQAVEEMKQRYALPLIPAEKIGKSDFIELMNSDFRMGHIKLLGCEELAEEYISLIWDDRTAKREEHPSCPNHLADATLYAWRYCYNYVWKERTKIPAPQSEDIVDMWWKEEEEKLSREKSLDFI